MKQDSIVCNGQQKSLSPENEWKPVLGVGPGICEEGNVLRLLHRYGSYRTDGDSGIGRQAGAVEVNCRDGRKEGVSKSSNPPLSSRTRNEPKHD
jgi:hypothetical protein